MTYSLFYERSPLDALEHKVYLPSQISVKAE